MVAGLVIGLAMGFVNAVVSWVPCLGWIVGMAISLISSAYIGVVYAHLFGQFGRVASGQNQLAQVA